MGERAVVSTPADSRLNSVDGCAFAWEAIWLLLLALLYSIPHTSLADRSGDFGVIQDNHNALYSPRLSQWRNGRSGPRLSRPGISSTHNPCPAGFPGQDTSVTLGFMHYRAVLCSMSLSKTRRLG
ncbi:hypothetical protein K431DRAFT_19247 [Polychaeton citri CBS 116435]|uniref:Uncharacterized protein n=1 Tax=Polychaeton citri CBS 116435 TaxID=1314669 RepID=A0A9P4PYZ7_9PEZI|nr:hypothetical protein K431DRAFT_19247 [Polychaeton citri CBS 116435]